jgi:uncharacterized membrane protein HdeD (DUF308 family)
MDLLVNNWWALAIRGVVAILFGVATLFWPNLTLIALLLLFASYALIDGIFAIAAAFQGEKGGSTTGLLILEGLIGVGAAVVTVLWPGITAQALVVLIGAFAICRGVIEIAAAIRLRKVIRNEWALGVAGLLAVALGVLLLLYPSSGAVAMALWIGVFALAIGVALLALALELRSLQRKITRPPDQLGAPVRV